MRVVRENIFQIDQQVVESIIKQQLLNLQSNMQTRTTETKRVYGHPPRRPQPQIGPDTVGGKNDPPNPMSDLPEIDQNARTPPQSSTPPWWEALRPKCPPRAVNGLTDVAAKLLLVAITCLIAVFMPKCEAQPIVCGEENWFYGFTSDHHYEMQVMEHSSEGRYVVVGARDTLDEAVVIAIDMDTGTTLNHFEVDGNLFNFDGTFTYEITGVQQIKFSTDDTIATVLMEVDTSADPTVLVYAMMQFTLGSYSNVRLGWKKMALASPTPQPVWLIQSNPDKIDLLIQRYSGQLIKHLKFDFTTNTQTIYTMLNTGSPNTLTYYLGDAVVTPDDKIVFVARSGNDKAVLGRVNSDHSGSHSPYLVVNQVHGNEAEYKLVCKDQDTVQFVVKDKNNSQIKILTVDVTATLTTLLILSEEQLLLNGSGAVQVSEMTIQSAYYVSRYSFTSIIASTSTGFIQINEFDFFKAAVTRQPDPVTNMPYIFDDSYASSTNMSLHTTAGTLWLCQYGLSQHHVERLCPEVFGYTATCGAYFDTFIYGLVTKTPVNPNTETDTVLSDNVLSSVTVPANNKMTTTSIDGGDQISLTVASPMQIVDPCGVVPVNPFDDYLGEFKIDMETPQLLNFKTDLTPTLSDELCPDPSKSLGYDDSWFQLVPYDIQQPSGIVKSASTSFEYDIVNQSLVFDLTHSNFVTVGNYNVGYNLFFATDATNPDWQYRPNLAYRQVIVTVIQFCDYSTYALPTIADQQMMLGDPPLIIDVAGAHAGTCFPELTITCLTCLQYPFLQQQPVLTDAEVSYQTGIAPPLVDTVTKDAYITFEANVASDISEFKTVPYYSILVTLSYEFNILATTSFEVSVLAPPCIPNLIVPSWAETTVQQTGFDPLADPLITPTQTSTILDFSSFSNGDCEFSFDIVSTTLPDDADLTLTQPTFAPIDPYNEYQVSATTPGQLEMDVDETMLDQSYQVVLRINDLKDSTSQQFTLSVEVVIVCPQDPRVDGSNDKNVKFKVGETWKPIGLTKIENGNCWYNIVFDASQDPHAVPLSYNLIQAQFDPLYANYPFEYVTEIDHGYLEILANDLSMIGMHTLIMVQIEGQPADAEVLELRIEIEPPDCTPATYFDFQNIDLEYRVAVGDSINIDFSDSVIQDGDCAYSMSFMIEGVIYSETTNSCCFFYAPTFVDTYTGYSKGAQQLDLQNPPRFETIALAENYANTSWNYKLIVSQDSLSAEFDFKAIIYMPCTENPTIITFTGITITQGDSPMAADEAYLSSFQNGNCGYELTMVANPEPPTPFVTIVQPTFTPDDPISPEIVTRTSLGSLTIDPSEIHHIGTYTMTLTLTSTVSSSSTSQTATYIVEAPLCVGDPFMPQLPSSVTMFTDMTEEFKISLEGSRDGDCKYSFSVYEEHNGHNSQLFYLIQPTFTTEKLIPTIVTGSTPGSLFVRVPDLTLLGSHLLTVKLLEQTSGSILTDQSITIDIRPPLCTPELTIPESLSLIAKKGEPEQLIELEGITSSDCAYSIELLSSQSQIFSLEQPEFEALVELIPDQVALTKNGVLRIDTPNASDVGVQTFVIAVTDGAETQFLSVSVLVEDDSQCEPNLVLPELRDQEFLQSSKSHQISLEGLANGSCRFQYSLQDDKGQVADPSLFSVVQPSFIGSDGLYEVEDSGKIIVSATQAEHQGTHSLKLKVQTVDGQTVYKTFNVKVNVCVAIASLVDRETELVVLYAYGSGDLTTQVPTASQSCPNSSFKFLAFDEKDVVPQFVTWEPEPHSFTINTESSDDAGEYRFKAVETDNSNFRTATTIFNVYIDSEEALALKLAQSTNNTASDSGNYTEFSVEYFKKKFNYKPTPGKVPKPLKAQIFDITPKGNLTIVFSKPIILPPIELFEEYRKLQEVNSDDQVPQGARNYSLSNVLKIYAESSFYDTDSKEIKILNYNLTRLTERALDVQIQWKEPEQVTISKIEPDVLKVDFKMSNLFIDAQDFQSFEEEELILEYPIVPQYSSDYLEELEQFESAVEGAMTTFSIGNLIFNLFLAVGLKYLWNMVTLLQFVIFMRQWIVRLPDKANIFLKHLKSLALFEFLPTDEIDDVLMDWFGIDPNKDAAPADENETLFEKLAVFILAGIAIMLVLLLMLGFRLCMKKYERARKCYHMVKRKLLYNTFIRYVLLGTLKIQITFGSTVLIGVVIPATLKSPEPDSGSRVLGIIVLILMTLMPALFGWVLYANRGNLGKDEVKSKIGAMYFTLVPDKPYIGSYTVTFLARRSYFVLITFALYNFPSGQVEAMLYSTMLYICYISNMAFYESKNHRLVEAMNECILIGICYHFVIFANPSFDVGIRNTLGTSCIAFVCTLLGINTLVIIGVNIITIKRKLTLRWLKKKAEKMHAQRLAEKQAAELKKKEAQQENQLEVVVRKPSPINNINLSMPEDSQSEHIQVVLKNNGDAAKQDQPVNQGEERKQMMDGPSKLESFAAAEPDVLAEFESIVKNKLMPTRGSKAKKKKKSKGSKPKTTMISTTTMSRNYAPQISTREPRPNGPQQYISIGDPTYPPNQVFVVNGNYNQISQPGTDMNSMGNIPLHTRQPDMYGRGGAQVYILDNNDRGSNTSVPPMVVPPRYGQATSAGLPRTNNGPSMTGEMRSPWLPPSQNIFARPPDPLPQPRPRQDTRPMNEIEQENIQMMEQLKKMIEDFKVGGN